MKKILFVLLLAIPALTFAQREFDDGIILGEGDTLTSITILNDTTVRVVINDTTFDLSVGNRVASLEVNDYTKLGSDAPKIKMKKLTGISPNQGANGAFAHGLDKAKIIGIHVLITNNSGNRIPPNFTSVGSHEFEFFIDGDDVRIYCKAANSSQIDNNTFTVLLTYEN